MTSTKMPPPEPQGLRRRQWSPLERAVLIAAIAIACGGLFVTTYSLAPGDPVPHRVPAGLVGQPTENPEAVAAVQQVARHSLVFRPYATLPAALHAISEQNVYTALDVQAARPTLYVASAAGASMARGLLERIYAVFSQDQGHRCLPARRA